MYACTCAHFKEFAMVDYYITYSVQSMVQDDAHCRLIKITLLESITVLYIDIIKWGIEYLI